MTVAPYTPTPLTVPIWNPAVGGTGTPYPYISTSQYSYAPTSVDTNSLYADGSSEDQLQVLGDTIRRASGWADRIVFGADPAAKGASLCATLSVEVARVPVVRRELRLLCDYKPIIQVNGIDIGYDMATLTSVGSNVAGRVRIGRRTLYVPLTGFAVRANDIGNPERQLGMNQMVTAVWSYVNGYPHTLLAGAVTAGDSTCSVLPTDGFSGLLGIIPNTTQMTIVDGAQTERFTVQSISGTTLTSATPFRFDHAPPDPPDSVVVTALPEDVSLANIFLTTALIKTGGDNSLVLDEITEPKQIQRTAGDIFEDFNMACRLLKPFRVNVKTKV